MPYYRELRQPYPNELYHHGIKGQKWGIRRYQNPDGSLTEEGKQKLKKAAVGLALGTIGVTAGVGIAKGVGGKISAPIMSKYFYDATPENAALIKNGLESVGIIPMAIIGETAGVKIGHKICDRYFGTADKHHIRKR